MQRESTLEETSLQQVPLREHDVRGGGGHGGQLSCPQLLHALHQLLAHGGRDLRALAVEWCLVMRLHLRSKFG